MYTKKLTATIVLLTLGLVAARAEQQAAKDVPKAWRSLDAKGLAKLAADLAAKGREKRAEREILLSYLSDRYLSDAAATRSVSLDAWSHLTYLLAGDMRPEVRSRWARAIPAAFAPSRTALLALELKEALTLDEIMTCLDDKRAGRFSVGLLASAASWDDFRFTADNVLRLSHCMLAAGEESEVVRHRFVRYVESTYLTSKAAARKLSLEDWHRMVLLVAARLSPETKRAWGDKIRYAWASDEKEFLNLDPLQIAYLVSAVNSLLGKQPAGEILAAYVSASSTWEKADPEALAELVKRLRYATNRDAAVSRLWRHIDSKYLADLEATRSVPLAAWSQFVTGVGRQLPKESQTTWGDKLYQAFAGDAQALRALGALDVRLLTTCLYFLRHPSSDKLAFTWIDAVGRQALAKATPGSVAGMLEKAANKRENRAAVLSLLKELEPAWRERYANGELAYGDCKGITGALGGRGFDNPTIQKQWALRTYYQYLRDDKFARIQRLVDDPAGIDRLLRGLGLGDEFWECSCPTIFWRLMVAAPEDRKGLWEVSVRTLTSEKITPAIFPELDKLLPELEKGGSLSALQALSDLHAISTDHYAARPILRERMNVYELVAKTRTAAADLRELAAKATSLHNAGVVDKAIPLYRQIITKNGKQRSIVRAARRCLLPLLFRQQPADLTGIESQLSALRQEGPPTDLLTYELRLLLRNIGAANPSQRKSIWATGLRKLAESFRRGEALSEEAFNDLDTLCGGLTRADTLSRLQLLTDLLVLAPEVATMRRLQSRRIQTFVEDKAWSHAQAAARMDACLAIAGRESPCASVGRYLAVMESAGVPDAEAKAFEERMLWGATRRSGGNQQTATRHSLSIDGPLTEAAKAALDEQQATAVDPRCRAFRELFTEHGVEAAKHAHAALMQTPADEERIEEALADISAVLAIADGSFCGSSRFACCLAVTDPEKWNGNQVVPEGDSLLAALVGCEMQAQPKAADRERKTYGDLPRQARRDLARSILRRRQERLMGWGLNALREDEKIWAQALWSLAADGVTDAEGVSDLYDRLYTRAKSVCSPEASVDLLNRLAFRLRSLHAQRLFLVTIAKALQDARKLPESLAVLDREESLRRQHRAAPDMTAGFTRATSLIAMARLDDAATVLEGMKAWPGTREELARASFLAGWIYLKQGKAEKAAIVLQQVVDKYPEASFTRKAKKLLEVLDTE